MSSFDAFCNEKIFIEHRDGRQTGPLKASFGNGKFTVFDGTLDVSEGDFIARPLQNGKADRYDIVEVKYVNKFHGIPANVQMTANKQGGLVQFNKRPVVNNISISHSQGVQIGDHNTQNILDAFKEILQRIDKSSASQEQKSEAKSALKLFLDHPLTSAVIGGAIGGVTGLLK